ncbi:hypothetical protein ACODT3_36985 [Streptomyces sp. 4.24]|uniref:hypothetical protein n=1 Tax=Streptomyces tritrimontium TaxID=3406573 RepID=UPI003BB5065A
MTGALPGGFGPGDRRAEYIRALHGDLPTAFTIRCSGMGGRCRKVRARALALPKEADDALVILSTRAMHLPMLIRRTFEGACTAPTCPVDGHDRFYEKDMLHLAPGVQEDSARLKDRYAGGVVRTVILCMDLQLLRPYFEEFRDRGKVGELPWAPGNPGTLLKPEWQRNAPRIQLNKEARNS